MVQQLQHVFDILCILNDEIQFHVELATDQLKRVEKKRKMMNLNPNTEFTLNLLFNLFSSRRRIVWTH